MNPQEIITKIRLGMKRSEVISALGEPTNVSITTKKKKFPSAFKYGDIELHFTGSDYNATLCLVYSEDEEGNGITHLK